MNGAWLSALFVLLPLGCLIPIAALLRLRPGVWTATVGDVDKGRNHTVDGARGLLTLWVLTHHLNALPEVLAFRRPWAPPPGVLGDLMLNGLFVAPFFALTAVIFGGQLLQLRGEIEPLPFIKRRLFRLAPVYLLSIVLIFASAFVLSRFELRVAPLQLLKELVRWSLLDFVPRYGVNGVDASEAHGMLWTLRVELVFYLMLPILAFAQRRIRSPAPLFIGLLLASLYESVFYFFLAGAFAAAALGWSGGRFARFWNYAAVVGLIGLIATAHDFNRILQAALLIPIIVALVRETPLFAALRWRPLRFVGEISYSVYILHNPMIWILYSLVLDPRWALSLSYVERLVIGIACGGVILIISTAAYVWVERPGVRLGRRASRDSARRFLTRYAPKRAGS